MGPTEFVIIDRSSAMTVEIEDSVPIEIILTSLGQIQITTTSNQNGRIRRGHNLNEIFTSPRSLKSHIIKLDAGCDNRSLRKDANNTCRLYKYKLGSHVFEAGP